MQTTDFVATLFDGPQGDLSKITIGLTMAVNAARKGHSCTIILMADAVLLGKPNATDPIDIGPAFKPAKVLLEEYLSLGGKIAVCSSCMKHNNMSEADLDPQYLCITASDVIDLTMNAKGTLQIA